MADLKPCPFCNGEAVLHSIQIPVRTGVLYEYWAECQTCGAGFSESTNKQEAIEAWNRRTNDDSR